MPDTGSIDEHVIVELSVLLDRVIEVAEALGIILLSRAGEETIPTWRPNAISRNRSPFCSASNARFYFTAA